jgi:hypothetical protein
MKNSIREAESTQGRQIQRQWIKDVYRVSIQLRVFKGCWSHLITRRAGNDYSQPVRGRQQLHHCFPREAVPWKSALHRRVCAEHRGYLCATSVAATCYSAGRRVLRSRRHERGGLGAAAGAATDAAHQRGALVVAADVVVFVAAEGRRRPPEGLRRGMHGSSGNCNDDGAAGLGPFALPRRSSSVPVLGSVCPVGLRGPPEPRRCHRTIGRSTGQVGRSLRLSGRRRPSSATPLN